MLDPAILDQLREHFSKLTTDITLSIATTSHPKRVELVELATEVASLSPRLAVAEGPSESDGIALDVLRDGAPTGIRFRGVPGGHEFTSFVLAILNAGGLGKLPDPGIAARVRRLKGPIRLRTYVSLSCTNCPDVVQALNVMALYHDDFVHEMVDGALAEDEVAALGVQAVPAVFDDEGLVHVGKSTFAELLETLGERYGSATDETAPVELKKPVTYDVIVVGGGPAGCSAAIYSVRKGLRTALVAQKFGGQVAETLGIENLVSVPYTEGARLTRDLEKHVRAYPVDLFEHRKVQRIERGDQKRVVLTSGEILESDVLVVATGARWRELGIPGEKEYLGRGVAFCPHCDGPFYKGRKVAVIGGGNSGVEAAIDLAGICSHVTLFEFLDQLKADDVVVRKLRSLPNVDVVTGARTTEILGNGDAVTGLRYQDRASEDNHDVTLDGVFIQIGLVPNSAVVKDLVETNRYGEIVVDEKCRTSVPGIYAAGDVTTVPWKQIVIAVGEGAKAALAAFEDRMRQESATSRAA